MGEGLRGEVEHQALLAKAQLTLANNAPKPDRLNPWLSLQGVLGGLEVMYLFSCLFGDELFLPSR